MANIGGPSQCEPDQDYARIGHVANAVPPPREAISLKQPPAPDHGQTRVDAAAPPLSAFFFLVPRSSAFASKCRVWRFRRGPASPTLFALGHLLRRSCQPAASDDGYVFRMNLLPLPPPAERASSDHSPAPKKRSASDINKNSNVGSRLRSGKRMTLKPCHHSSN